MTKQVRICHVQIIDVRQVYVLVVADGQMPFQRFSGVQNVRCRFTRRLVRFVDRKRKKLTSDVRPVFPEERLLLEIILEKPLAFEKDSVWNGNGNNYFVNGKKLNFLSKI